MTRYVLQPITGAGTYSDPNDVNDVGNTIRNVGASAPNTYGWFANDVWLDTVAAATANIPRIWTGTGFLPARPTGGGVAPVVFDQFTGANNAAWSSNFAVGIAPGSGTGSGATIQSNAGRLSTSNLGGYNGSARISRKVNLADRADANMTFNFMYDSTECYPVAMIRANSTVDTQQGYAIAMGKGSWDVQKYTSYVGTTLIPGGVPIIFEFAEGIWYTCRFSVVGTAIKAKIWTATNPEPPTFQVSVTDSTYSAAGAYGWSLGTGNAAVASNWYIDNVLVEAS